MGLYTAGGGASLNKEPTRHWGCAQTSLWACTGLRALHFALRSVFGQRPHESFSPNVRKFRTFSFRTLTRQEEIRCAAALYLRTRSFPELCVYSACMPTQALTSTLSTGRAVIFIPFIETTPHTKQFTRFIITNPTRNRLSEGARTRVNKRTKRRGLGG